MGPGYAAQGTVGLPFVASLAMCAERADASDRDPLRNLGWDGLSHLDNSAALSKTNVPVRVDLTVKRLLDLVCAAVALVITAPLMACISVAIRFTLGRPVMYRQVRIGQGEQPFNIVKFRTMRHPSPNEVEFFSDQQRVTRLGRMLRASSLDELPELWHVLKGQMSLVGPRPLLPAYLELYRGDQRLRHSVRPGLTGLAQIKGRQDLTLSQRLDLDVEYVRKRNMRLDLVILYRTLILVLRRKGVRTGQRFEDVDDIGLAEALRQSRECRHTRDGEQGAAQEA